MSDKAKEVAVLMGGWSAEREVSLVSGAACAKGLTDAGYHVTCVDVQRDIADLMGKLMPRPEVIFNALHGRFGEDGCIQGLLNMLNIPYTHSGVLASAVAMDKPLAKRLFSAAGLAIAEHKICTRDDVLAGDPLAKPYVIKPLNEGSSVGVHIVRDGDNEPLLSHDNWHFGHEVMVEAFVSGREFTVAVMGDKPLAVTEISTQRGFYDYEAKYTVGGSTHQIPADIDEVLYQSCLDAALVAHQALGCRGVSRADFRYDGKRLVILEVNTQPGMTPTSLVPEQAAHLGISFSELCAWMVEHAECDQ